MGRVYGANVVIGIPSFGMVSTYFAQSLGMMQFPLVSSSVHKYVLDKPIAEARNEIVEWALSQGSNYIFWLDDDVVAPPDAFLKLYRHNKDIINGVYWSKSNPPMPLLFRNHLEGPYMDWHIGDLIKVDAAGMGLTLIRTDVYRKMAKETKGPWYSTEYFSFPGVEGSFSPPNNTEDLYFYWKARELGYDIYADTSVQAGHFEKNSKVFYGMPPYSPQAHPAFEIKPKDDKLIADLGSGPYSPYFQEGESISFDIREEVHPDVVCDIRYLPVADQTFDMVYSSHTLEHFPWIDMDKILKEWSRILKIGGEMVIVVPNLRWSAKRLLEDTPIVQDMWVLYGEQNYGKNFHTGGFTPNLLKSLVESLDIYEDIRVTEGNIDGPPDPINWNLEIRATKKTHKMVENITPKDIEKGPEYGAMWPFRLFDQTTEQPEKTIEEDKVLHASPAKTKKTKVLKELEAIKLKETEEVKVEEPVKETANGLASDL